MIHTQELEEKRLALAERERKKYGIKAEFAINPSLPSFQISAKNGKLQIEAPDALELLYGVYECAERFCGWYFFEPGRDMHNDSWVVSSFADGILVSAKKPLLKIRGFIQEFPFNDETESLLWWMAKNKLNYIQTWMKYYDGLSREKKELALLLGIEIESGHHNFDYWIPGAVYGKTHPEFFAEIGGHRINPSGSKDKAFLLSEQLCTTNPGMRDEMARNMIRYCEENPEVSTIAIVPNDGFGWCECPECSKFYDKSKKGDLYSLSEHVYKAGKIYHNLVKDVSARVHKVHPEITINSCAYINYSRPEEGVTLEKGNRISFANYWRCINHTIDDPDCYVNSHLARDIREWDQVNHGGEIIMYEYFMGVNFYLSLPMIHWEEMFHEMEWYRQNGVCGITTQFHIPHWTVYGSNYRMMAQASRGDDRDEAIRTMLFRLYGKDAPDADAFRRKVKQLLLELPGRCMIPYPFALFSRTVPAQFESLRQDAQLLAEKDPGSSLRKELVIWTEYLLRFKRLFDEADAGTLTEEGIDAFLQWIHAFRNTRIFVHEKFDCFFDAAKEAVRTGKKWYHFNLDWEDNYIRKHRQMWKEQAERDANEEKSGSKQQNS